jgi:hypothetical protein
MKNIDAFVKRIDTVSERLYSQCKAIVDLAVLDGNGNTSDLTVVYPMQDSHHLTMLMKNKETGRDISHDAKFPIAKAIMTAIGKA